MSPIKSCLTRCLVLSLTIAFFTGCAQEDWRWDWWNKDTKKTQTKPVASKPRPADQPRQAEAKPAADRQTAEAQSKPDDPQASDVEHRVRRFTESATPREKEPEDYNDFNSKIERQQDPERHRRIAQTAKRAGAEAEPSGHGAARVASAPPRNNEAKMPVDEGATRQAQPADMSSMPLEPEPIQSSDETEAKPTTIAEAPSDTTSENTDEPQAQMLTGDTTTPVAEPAAEPSKVAANRVATAADAGAESPAKNETIAKPEPPKLAEVRVAAGPEVKPVESAAERVDLPKANTPQVKTVTIDTFKQKLEQQQQIVAKDPNNIAEQLRLRMMYLIDKQDDKALALDEGMDIETHAIIQAQIRAMMASREADGRDPATFANNLLESVENLRTLVRAKADLSVPKVILCKSTEGFGVYEPFSPTEFPAGRRQEVLIYIEVDNFSSEITPKGFSRTLLTLRPSLLNKKTGEEVWSTTYENIEDLSRGRRRDFFLAVSQTIPASLSPGDYVLKVEVEDVLVGKINSNFADFKMVASPTAAATGGG